MQMNMEYRLSGIRIAIHDNTIAALGETLLRRYFFRRNEQTANGRHILNSDLIDRGNVFLWDYYCVGRRLWIDIPEGHNSI